jgi:hypothetical protein
MMKARIMVAVFILFTGINTAVSFSADGFDLSTHSIPVDEIESGGPAKDAIPALSDPVFVNADRATFLEPNDIVLGVEIDGRAKAYPVKILNWHEAVNDELSGQKILATW